MIGAGIQVQTDSAIRGFSSRENGRENKKDIRDGNAILGVQTRPSSK